MPILDPSHPLAQLRRAREEGDAQALVRMLDTHGDGISANQILQALGTVGDPAVLDDVLAYLEVDRRPGVQNSGMATLGALKDPSVVPILERAIQRRGEPCRYGAAEGIASIGGPEAVRILRIGLEDDQAIFRSHVADQLGEVGSDDAVEALGTAAADRSWWVRRSAREALVKIASPAATEALSRIARTAPTWMRRRAFRRSAQIVWHRSQRWQNKRPLSKRQRTYLDLAINASFVLTAVLVMTVGGRGILVAILAALLVHGLVWRSLCWLTGRPAPPPWWWPGQDPPTGTGKTGHLDRD